MSKKEKNDRRERRDRQGDNGRELKEKCCEKYKKKGRHCKSCPIAATCDLPG